MVGEKRTVADAEKQWNLLAESAADVEVALVSFLFMSRLLAAEVGVLERREKGNAFVRAENMRTRRHKFTSRSSRTHGHY